MLHRRRLRALCRRCQYGRAAATLNRFYPQVLERCPELLVQLRCRQLIEMMRRHAVRRGRSHTSNSGSDLNDSNSTTAPPKVQRVSGSLHVGSGCCVTNKPDKLSQDTSNSVQMIVENGLPPLSMDVDSENVLKAPSLENAVKVVGQKTKVDQDCNLFTELDDLETADVEDEEDDDGFGVDDDTGVCIDILLPHTNSKSKLSSNGSYVPSGMDADNGMSSAGSTSKPTEDVSFNLSANSELDTDDEMRCLLRHVQFGRSLVNLVRQVRAKTGGLSLETERLLQVRLLVENLFIESLFFIIILSTHLLQLFIHFLDQF
ncbi:Ran-binding protein 9, variant 2 [Schistosoma haematobium]|uniref:Ran-binding protein 9, variant 2 n=1 Tax=Schistosoma haematobium TaxID=6185 RepID=A0A922LQ56_SCHHA|nr:Ran-binding protein 9, variant 2 [Schistosoma haematobium]KAH9591373.1 Ran-binding protein 9, variant 2 [Schistosoma haematobium]